MMQLVALLNDIWVPLTVGIIIVLFVGEELTRLFPPDR